jgi:hypothetical protein
MKHHRGATHGRAVLRRGRREQVRLEEVERIAANYPVFRIAASAATGSDL